MRLYCQGTTESTQVQHVARFIMEITLFTRDFVGVKSSNVARGCLLMARHICGLTARSDLCPQEKEVKHVTTCLDVLFSEHTESVSTICVEKYAPHYYSKASTITMQFYAMGRRYRPVESPLTPANVAPSVWARRESEYSNSSPSGFYSTSSSECGDETLPRTPCTPVGAISSVDPFVVPAMSVSLTSQETSTAVMSGMKENLAPQGYDVLGPKKALPPQVKPAFAPTQHQRVVLQSIQNQAQQPRSRRLSN